MLRLIRMMIRRDLKQPRTISLISSTSIEPPPSVSKAVKIQFSFSSAVVTVLTDFT